MQNQNFTNQTNANTPSNGQLKITFGDIVEGIRPEVPENFSSMTSLEQFDVLIKLLDRVLNIQGQWFLVNGDLTMREFIMPSIEKGRQSTE